MADGRHIENRLLAISPRFIVRITRNFVWRSRITFRHIGHVTKILKIQDGGRPPFWKWFYRYISAWNHPISMKFGVQTHILVQGRSHAQFNSKWRTAAILQIVFLLYLHELLSDWRGIWYVQVEPGTLYNGTGNSAHCRLAYADFWSGAWTMAPCGGE